MDTKSAMLYAQLKPFKHLVNKTSGFIRWALERVENPYLACSFGKDSAVILHLTLQHLPNIPVRFIRWQNETEHIDNYDEIISQWNLPNLHQITLSRSSLADSRKDRYHTEGYDSYFIGLRKDESVPRRITLKKHGMFHTLRSGLTRIAPLADWTTRDVAAYAVSNKLPTLNSYLTQGMDSRTASRIPRSDHGIRENFLNDLRQRDFEGYQQLLQKFPEIKEYA
jgi:3'-phosphoadenosine 5'-phosphosulfate sulfotransferase (PAPS reductase)/FAD synthetase